MKLKCENIGKLSSAEVEINSITVIAGLNSTGKSTVGKVLYCIFNSFHDLKTESIRILSSYLERKFFEGDIFFGGANINPCINTLLKKRNNISVNEVKAIIHNYLGEEFTNKKSDVYYNDIQRTLNLTDKELYTSILQNKIFSEFNNQIQNLYFPTQPSKVVLTIGKQNIEVNIHNNEITDLQNFMDLRTEVIYIDDPFVLDNLSPIYGMVRSGPGHKSDLIRKLRIHAQNKSEIENVINQNLISHKIDRINNKLNEACNGNIVLNKKRGFSFHINDTNSDLEIINISTGLKAFAIIKTLLMNGSLEQKGTLVLDEPEIHLHPQWQILLAEIIVLIQKEFDMHILINSHSPYFIDAIDKFSQVYEIRDTCKFYCSQENDNNTSILNDVTDDLTPIYELLYQPMETIDKINIDK